MGKIFTNDEEKRLVVLAKEGNEDAFKNLGTLYKPLFLKSAGKIPTLASDAMSAAYEGFFLAIKNFDLTKNVPFAAYLKKMVRCAVFDVYRKEMRFAKRHVLPPAEDNPIDYAESETDDMATFEARFDILNAMKTLTKREKEVVREIYFHGLNTVETGKLLGISRKTVSDAKLRAIKKLRQKLNDLWRCH